MRMRSLAGLFVLLIHGCGGGRSPGDKGRLVAGNLVPALSSITADDLLRHIRILASDEFEGRAPETAGEEKTVQYLTWQFKKLGLQPGNPDGTYVQKVPLVRSEERRVGKEC